MELFVKIINNWWKSKTSSEVWWDSKVHKTRFSWYNYVQYINRVNAWFCIITNFKHTFFFISNYDLALTLKLAYIFKIFRCSEVKCKMYYKSFQGQPLPIAIFLKCWDLVNLKIFPRKYVERNETTVLWQTFCLQYYKNYPQLTFYCCFLQGSWTLKVG